MTVSLTRFRTDDVLPAFAKCLAKLPNLHTIQIVHAHSQMTTALKNAFEGRSFPGVRTMILPACAHEILRCCPLVEDVTCNESDGSKIVTALCAAKASKLTSLRGVSLTDNSVKRERLPNDDLVFLIILPLPYAGLAKTAINLRSIHFVNNGVSKLRYHNLFHSSYFFTACSATLPFQTLVHNSYNTSTQRQS